MSQKKVNWTQQQSRAISEHSRSVLVSASAGTGKTAVLSGSCVDIVLDKSACPDVWSVLVVTFTDMAAEQMRRRIAEQLRQQIDATQNAEIRRHLCRQLVLLGAADISTIHSFCKRIITEHFHLLGLDPTFRVLDADEAKLLKAEVLEKTIDFGWQQEHIAAALRQLLTRRDLRTTDGFLTSIIRLSDFLDGVPSRSDWLTRAKTITDAADPFATDLAQSQKQIISEKLQDALDRLTFALKIYQSKSPAGVWAEKFRHNCIRPVQHYLGLLKADNWDTLASALITYEKPTVYKPKDAPDVADAVKSMADDAVKTIASLKDFAILNPDYLGRLAGAVSTQTRALIELVERFDYFYTQAKCAVNCLDFADLEHYALKLLTASESPQVYPGGLTPSQTALKLREKYKYVFVDEYQDINGVQQAILDMLSAPGRLFAVGDPKQSIYQWRGADPDIFIAHLKRASTKPAGDIGLRVDLNVNFRSVKGVLDFVNSVFGRIMTGAFTNIDYDESAHLRPPLQNSSVSKTNPAVEMHILDEQQAGYESSRLFNDRQLQAAMIARRIKQLVGENNDCAPFQIPDKKTGGVRPVEYRDIVVLMRSLAGKNDFLEVLRLSGIPVSCEATAGYFEATEITDMLCLLKVLDNPRRDIELAAVLRSPFFNLTDTDLAKIRLTSCLSKAPNFMLGVNPQDKPGGFYDCVLNCSKSQDDRDLADKLNAILTTIDKWRTIARRGNLAGLIWHIYRQTGSLSFVCALPDGLARRANLLKLHDRAIQFENFSGGSGVPSLSRFIDFVEKLLSAGQDWAPAEPESAAGNAVRVLSVHKSKGLEFPVVFLADLDSPFNKKADRKDCIMDERLTLGLQVIDAQNNSRIDSLAYQVIEQRNRQKSLAEEMRILYVAMTRAVDRLILVGSKAPQSCRHILSSASFFNDKAIPHWRLASCTSCLDWILLGLGNLPALHKAFQTGHQTAAADDLFSVELYDQPEIAKLSSAIQNSKLSTQNSTLKTQPGKLDLTQLKQSLNWRYPFGDAPQLPAKRSVTQFTHRNDEFTKLDYSLTLNRMPKAVLTAEMLDGRSIGSVTHLVLSQIDLAAGVTAESITRLISWLVAEGQIAQSLVSYIDIDSIIKFFKTNLGQKALDKNNTVLREWPFTFAVPASQWSESETHDTRRTTQDYIIIQGIIDLLIETPNGLVIVDFKTDNVPADKLPDRAKLYRSQLDLYAQAAGAITGKKVCGKWLYFLKPGCIIEV
ncbi:MAG: helicase-exonuclease AddAB subunit AddA [Sedimentisphaerales bacterium]